jgi:hypothetical protein
MGMIPVVLAIAGFVLLWMIVNYNSLSAKRKNIGLLQESREQALHSYVSLTKQLSALLWIHGIEVPLYLVNLANEPGQKIEGARFSRSLEQIKVQARTQPGLQGNPDYSDLIHQIEVTARRLLKNQQLLLAEIRAYNGQATQMPYRIVARLFGFRKVNSPIVR